MKPSEKIEKLTQELISNNLKLSYKQAKSIAIIQYLDETEK